jgi:hypothetical protein
MYNFPTQAPIYTPQGEIIRPTGRRTRAKYGASRAHSTGTGIPVSREALAARRTYEGVLWSMSAHRKAMEEYPTSGRT